METHEDIQNQIKNLSSKTAYIEKMLGRGNKTVVLQFGARNLRFGMANDTNPQILKSLVARKVQEAEEATKAYEGELDSKLLMEINKSTEAFLTKKGNIPKAEGSQKAPKSKGQRSEPVKERCDLAEKPSEYTKDVYVGEEVYFVEGRKDYIVRQPLLFGLLNSSVGYSEAECIKDLELIVRRALSTLNVPCHSLDHYSVVICAPDKFHRGQFKLIIDMLIDHLGFGAFFIHLESVLASFGSSLSLCCVVDIGYSAITVTTVEEGVIVPNSQIKKHFGTRDIDALLYNALVSKSLFNCVPEASDFSLKKFKHLAAIEKIREKLGSVLLTLEEPERVIELNLPSEKNEPTKISALSGPAFVVALTSFFHSESLDLFDKNVLFANLPQFDRNSDYFEQYVDEEDFHDDTEVRVNKMMAQCLQSQDTSKKQQIFESSNIDVSKINTEYNFTNLEDIISYSIFQLKDGEARKKAANCIILTGGYSLTPYLIAELEDRLIERIVKFDPLIERVEVVNYAKREFDNSEITWIGASIIPKLDCMRDGFISKSKWTAKVNSEEEKDRRARKDCPEYGIKYLKEKIAFQW
jgi:actin-related protein